MDTSGGSKVEAWVYLTPNVGTEGIGDLDGFQRVALSGHENESSALHHIVSKLLELSCHIRTHGHMDRPRAAHAPQEHTPSGTHASSS